MPQHCAADRLGGRASVAVGERARGRPHLVIEKDGHSYSHALSPGSQPACAKQAIPVLALPATGPSTGCAPHVVDASPVLRRLEPGPFHAAESVHAGEPGLVESERRSTRTSWERLCLARIERRRSCCPFAGETQAFPGRMMGVDVWPRAGQREKALRLVPGSVFRTAPAVLRHLAASPSAGAFSARRRLGGNVGGVAAGGPPGYGLRPAGEAGARDSGCAVPPRAGPGAEPRRRPFRAGTGPATPAAQSAASSRYASIGGQVQTRFRSP